LVSVLRSDAKFWQSHPELREQLAAITVRAIELFPAKPDIAGRTVSEAVTRAYGEFKKRQAAAV
jgi:hypothetical protein